MALSRRVDIGWLNIAMHDPHSAELYEKLMRAAFNLKQMVQLGNLHAAILGTIFKAEHDGGRYVLTGEIYRFVRIDANEPWFNSMTKAAATEEEKQGISIPSHLLPNLQVIPFVFDLKKHQLAFASKDRRVNFGPGMAKRFFELLFMYLRQEETWPRVEVTAIPDVDQVEQILAIHKLQKLTIELIRPNPDDGGNLEQRLKEKLRKQRAQKEVTVLIANEGEGLKPDDETKRKAMVAASNGRVQGVGKDEAGNKVDDSTVAKPKISSVSVVDTVETTFDAIKRALGFR